jgi:[protein-PII] uridylyltransferase
MTARAELKTFLDQQRADFIEKPGFAPLEETICRKVDDIVLQIWAQNDRAKAKGFALLAIGGYGRRTLHPESDLDLLLFFRDKVDEDIAKAMLDPLWDLPFRVGHQIRVASDFKSFDPSHVESYAAFLDNRYLAGNETTSSEFQKEVLPGFLRRHRDAFLRGLLEAKNQRYERFGQTVFQLEPDLKDAPGGVRDFHWADWVARLSKALMKRIPNGLSRSTTACARFCTSRQSGTSTSCRMNIRSRSRRAWATANRPTAKPQRR